MNQDIIFKALAHKRRRDLLDKLLGTDGMTLNALCRKMSMTRQAVSKHLQILEDSGLIGTAWRGREKLHILNPAPVQAIYDRWIKKYQTHYIDELERLKFRLESREKGIRQNMVSFFYTSYIRTTPEKLWKALTDPEFTQLYWWGRRLESDWKVGSEIKALHDDNKVDWKGEVLVYQPYARLSYTFHLEEKPVLKNDKPSTVTFEISPEGKSIVNLTVIHENLSDKGFDDVSRGWPAILSSMKSMLEIGKSLDYT